MSVPLRDTALFFDLENLLDGYGDGLSTRVRMVSVPRIVALIKEQTQETGLAHEYAVKRAYANWTMSQLGRLRRDLVDEGIEPRQTFAFGEGGKANAADVELVIDALEVAYTLPAVTTFVVVSGDGGFGTLVRKLHEFGKAVVVCADKQKTSKSLRAVADCFVGLDPVESEHPESTSGPHSTPRRRSKPSTNGSGPKEPASASSN
jgi:uncharacterized LabA/DUF88 family protein